MQASASAHENVCTIDAGPGNSDTERRPSRIDAQFVTAIDISVTKGALGARRIPLIDRLPAPRQ